MASDRTFSDKIMIWEPLNKCAETFDFNKLKITTVNEFINLVKNQESEFLGEYGTENLSIDRIYIQAADILIGFREDKKLDNVFNDFSTDDLQLAYFIVGGASIHCMGYKFVVHPNEDIHRNNPHVHVCKDDDSVRYSLLTLERFKKDYMPRTYARDEKKIIIPYLKKNQAKLMNYWNLYINGYTVPVEDEYERQFYPES